MYQTASIVRFIDGPSNLCTYCNQVNEGHGVVMDPPECHDPNSVHSDHNDGDEVEQTGAQVQAQKQTAHNKCWQQTQWDVEEALWYDRQVLLVKNVGHPARWTRNHFHVNVTGGFDVILKTEQWTKTSST